MTKKVPVWVWIVSGVVVLGFIGLVTGGGDEPPAVVETVENVEPAEVEAVEVEAEPEACPAAGNTQAVSAECVTPWPLTVPAGVLICEPVSVVIFEDEEGNVWAVNGMAEAAGYEDIEPIWAVNPENETARINIGALIKAGLELCD